MIRPIRWRVALVATSAVFGLASGGLFAGSAYGASGAEQSHAGAGGQVFTLSNDAIGNRVIAFDRTADGSLVAAGSFATGGTGTGAGLGSQGALALSDDGQLLLAVNPGSNNVSVFAVGHDGLRLLDIESSGGTRPVSVTVHDHLVYVLNGGDNTISGLELDDHALKPVAGSTRSLVHPSAVAPQIGFTPDGEQVIVTEKTTDTIDVFGVNADGTTAAPQANASHGATPFGFGFDRRGHLLVSNAAGGAAHASSLTSYSVPDNGQLVAVDGPVANTQSASCWVAVSKNGRYAYTTNTGSASISGYRIGLDGTLSLLDANGVTATTGNGPIDADFSGNGRFLYTVNGGSHSITIDRIRADGSLDAVGEVTGLPVSAVGVAAS